MGEISAATQEQGQSYLMVGVYAAKATAELELISTATSDYREAAIQTLDALTALPESATVHIEINDSQNVGYVRRGLEYFASSCGDSSTSRDETAKTTLYSFKREGLEFQLHNSHPVAASLLEIKKYFTGSKPGQLQYFDTPVPLGVSGVRLFASL